MRSDLHSTKTIFLLSSDSNHCALLSRVLHPAYQVYNSEIHTDYIDACLAAGAFPNLVIVDTYSQLAVSDCQQRILTSLGHSVPRILITRNSSPHAEEERDQIGALDYLTVPFVISTLINRVQHLIAFSLATKCELE